MAEFAQNKFDSQIVGVGVLDDPRANVVRPYGLCATVGFVRNPTLLGRMRTSAPTIPVNFTKNTVRIFVSVPCFYIFLRFAIRAISFFVPTFWNTTSNSISLPIGRIVEITPVPNALCSTVSPDLKSGNAAEDFAPPAVFENPRLTTLPLAELPTLVYVPLPVLAFAEPPYPPLGSPARSRKPTER